MSRRARKDASVAELVQPRGKDSRLEAMAKVTAKMSGWLPARQVLRKVRAVQTIFPQFDRGTRVGGLPIDRITTIHGPSGEGKTLLTLGLIKSFLIGHHFVAHVDSEMTTPITWIEKVMGFDISSHPGYVAMRPGCMEEANDGVREFLTRVGDAKTKGIMPPETTGLVVIDSLRKLPPRNMLATLLKEGVEKRGADGMRGRGAQQRAALNAQWLDELVPLLNQTGCGLVIVARETEDPEADSMARRYGTNYKVGGGAAVIYDSSLVARIERARWLYQGSEDDKNVIGERHRVRVWKTKVGGKEDKVIDCYFHTSNGALIPEGFDRARDVFELAREMGIIKGEGSHFHWGNRKWHGENQAVVKLTAEPDALAELEAKVRAGFVVEGATAEVEGG